MVTLVKRGYATGHCEFAIDSEEDLKKLPRIGKKGQDSLSTLDTCSQGSLAVGTNGKIYILKGDTNEWVEF